ncbi:MAG TPA: T9SS type A sorting domain-containing protein [Chitinophagales bacterium]|nr:T9SS type A sorting domain-containing protein [Chitinophagales bacterium]
MEVGVVDFSLPSGNVLVYPNPIESNATLEYELVSSEEVTIDLVDIQGKLVQTFIANQNRPAGNHTATLHFDLNLPPSQYILRIGNGVSHQAVRIVKK